MRIFSGMMKGGLHKDLRKMCKLTVYPSGYRIQNVSTGTQLLAFLHGVSVVSRPPSRLLFAGQGRE